MVCSGRAECAYGNGIGGFMDSWVIEIGRTHSRAGKRQHIGF